MTVAYDEGLDEIFALFSAAWLANTPAIVGYMPDVRWPNIEEPAKPPSDKFWARVSNKTVLEEQCSMSACVEQPGLRRYEISGLVFVQIFCPKQLATASELGKKLAIIARNAFRGKQTEPGRVWFRNTTINELPPEALFYRYNVVSEYEFDDIG